MEEYKTMRYVYDTLEKALEMAEKFQELFLQEGIYDSHKIFFLHNGKFIVNVKICI